MTTHLDKHDKVGGVPGGGKRAPPLSGAVERTVVVVGGGQQVRNLGLQQDAWRRHEQHLHVQAPMEDCSVGHAHSACTLSLHGSITPWTHERNGTQLLGLIPARSHQRHESCGDAVLQPRSLQTAKCTVRSTADVQLFSAHLAGASLVCAVPGRYQVYC